MFEVIAPGIETTIQDSGRHGHRHVGIAQSGAADLLSLAIANHIIGNSWDTPALEVTLGGLSLQARQDVKITISGADMRVSCAGKRVPLYKPYDVRAGDILRFGFAETGARSYLAAAGGFDGDVFMGSRATYAPAKIGGMTGRALQAGDQLKSAQLPVGSIDTISSHLYPSFSKGMVLRVQKAPEFDSHLSADTQRRLFTERFIAGPLTNRMGARLEMADENSAPLSLSDTTPLTSSPLLPGTLEITENGLPILCGIDAHCTGGYARALSVIPADHWMMGQIASGTRIYFRRVTTVSAVTALNLRNKIYAQYIPDFRFD